MKQRLLGRTGHNSTVLAFGAAALYNGNERMAQEAVDIALDHGINHFDIAPSYGRAEELLGPLIPSFRERIFLACKTLRRDKEGAATELRSSLDRLRTDKFDLYQIHGVSSLEDVDKALGEGGAIETFLSAREQGTAKYIGITGHNAAAISEALTRFDFDTVMLPLNFVAAAHPSPENDFRPVLKVMEQKNLGAICIKAIAKGRWQTNERRHSTWYEPFDDQAEIDLALWFSLSHSIDTAVLPADVRLWPKVIDAAERLRDLSESEVAQLRAKAKPLRPLFPEGAG